MSKEERQAWFARANDVVLGGCREGMVCPVCGQSTLDVIEAPFKEGIEYHLYCSNCGAYNAILKRNPPET